METKKNQDYSYKMILNSIDLIDDKGEMLNKFQKISKEAKHSDLLVKELESLAEWKKNIKQPIFNTGT